MNRRSPTSPDAPLRARPSARSSSGRAGATRRALPTVGCPQSNSARGARALKELGCPYSQLVTRESERLHELARCAALAVPIVHPQPQQGSGQFLAQQFGNGTAEASGDLALLRRYRGAGLRHACEDRLFVERLDGGSVDNLRGDSSALQYVGCDEQLIGQRAGAD